MKLTFSDSNARLIANSVVNNFLFAHQTDMLADLSSAARLRQNSYELLLGINVNKHFPWIPDFLESLPIWISKPIMPPGLIDLLNLFDVSSYNSITIDLSLTAKYSGYEQSS